eukprot:94089-Amorphochlora_amoeboformis.AAC.1
MSDMICTYRGRMKFVLKELRLTLNHLPTNSMFSNHKETNHKKTNHKKTNHRKTNDKKTNDKKTNDKKTNDRKTNDRKTNPTQPSSISGYRHGSKARHATENRHSGGYKYARDDAINIAKVGTRENPPPRFKQATRCAAYL